MGDLIIAVLTLLIPALAKLVDALALSIGPAAKDVSFGEQVFDIIKTQDAQPKTNEDKHADAVAQIAAVTAARGMVAIQPTALDALVKLAVLRLKQEQGIL